MKTFMLLLGALAVLAGGGLGAYFYFAQPAVASAPEHVKKKKKVASKAEETGASLFQYVELEPLVLPIVDGSGVSQVVSMVIALEVVEPSAADKVRKLEPKLKDAYIQDMYGMLSEHAALKGGVVQIGYIKDRLNDISNRVLGNGKVNDVLIQVVQQRPV